METTALLERIGTHEEIARQKLAISDPYSAPFPYWHSTSFGNLRDILREGLISEEMAKRIGKHKYGRSGGVTIVPRHVSLANADPQIIPTPEIGILIDPSCIRVVNPRENPPEGTKPEDFKNLFHHEVLVLRRVHPSEFNGLVIGEYEIPMGDPYDSSSPTFPPMVPEKVIDLLKALEPKYALPVYFKSELIWPK